jgi:hypothetical protein
LSTPIEQYARDTKLELDLETISLD